MSFFKPTIPSDDRAFLQWLRDRAEIEYLGYAYAETNDGREKALPLYEQIFTEDVEVVYPFGSWKGIAAHKETNRKGLREVFTMTQHLLTNPIIQIDGDAAHARYYLIAAHGMKTDKGEKIVLAGAIYDQDCVRTPKGWRIRRHVCQTTWFGDDGELNKNVTEGANKR